VTAWRRAPLWLRLVTSLLALAALALMVNGLVGIRLLRGYLVGQVDQDLAAVVENPREAMFPDPASVEVPTSFYLALLDREGELVQEGQPLLYDRPPPDVEGFSVDDATARRGRPFTVDATSGHGNWRTVAIPSDDDQNTLVIATSLADVDETVARLSSINLLVGLCVLGGLAIAGYGIVRSALRRLVEIEQTAGAIARGDLARRVVDADPATEVGRLGQALNLMLDQIETAFRGREASEARAVHSEARMRQFVADASHELRTPLTSIRGFAELHRQGAVTDPAEVSELLARIEAEATRMGLLVDDLLLLARLDVAQPLDRELVDLSALVVDAVGDAHVAGPDHTWTLDLGPDAVLVTGDPPRLHQVLANLLTNARVHTPAGTTVHAGLSRDGDRAVLTVVDDGPGIPSKLQAEVFERFARGDSSRSRAAGSTGLGLAIVAAVVEAHHGTVKVASKPGRTEFTVTLPAAGRRA
jgi:two-component system, OmpR family, sensor kinase